MYVIIAKNLKSNWPGKYFSKRSNVKECITDWDTIENAIAFSDLSDIKKVELRYPKNWRDGLEWEYLEINPLNILE